MAWLIGCKRFVTPSVTGVGGCGEDAFWAWGFALCAAVCGVVATEFAGGGVAVGAGVFEGASVGVGLDDGSWCSAWGWAGVPGWRVGLAVIVVEVMHRGSPSIRRMRR